MFKLSPRAKYAFAGAAMLALSGCSATVNVRGGNAAGYALLGAAAGIVIANAVSGEHYHGRRYYSDNDTRRIAVRDIRVGRFGEEDRSRYHWAAANSLRFCDDVRFKGTRYFDGWRKVPSYECFIYRF